MKRILILVDSISYVRNEIYQHQLLASFDKRSDLDVRYVELASVSGRNFIKYDHIISLLKIRSLNSNQNKVRSFIDESLLRVVDYDPWVNFVDNSPYRGCYQQITQNINVERYYVSAKTWSDRVVNEEHLPCSFIKLGMMPAYCSFTPWENRTQNLEFKGTRHPWRVAGHQRLVDSGLSIAWNDSIIKPYNEFLKYLSTVKVWIHSEIGAWTIKGQQIVPNAVWPKAIEALARGCFVIRDKQEEMLYYDSEKMPALLTFETESQAPAVLEQLLSLTDAQRNEMLKETVRFISSYEYYDKIVEQLVDL